MKVFFEHEIISGSVKTEESFLVCIEKIDGQPLYLDQVDSAIDDLCQILRSQKNEI